MDTLVAEGPVTKIFERKGLFRKTFSYYKNGLWKEYDYRKREIVYIECRQGFSKIDSWDSRIIQKTEKMK